MMQKYGAVARDLAIVTAVYLVAILAVGVLRDWAAAAWLVVGLPALLAGRIVFHHKMALKSGRS
ncbi:hypothetical protein G3I77_39240 [Streptomyces sp. D2-8]|uniref:hypothetical protein n=1 Tax=Streptomyces sp. D2-8 TaxID=2707767 RepID=UPI0020BF482C|nr:hypothetical protein [Streptomyces sp. D2-8]MCK8438807.1 hypothetical protein [Streptomyces sp. D2-8]